MSEFQTVLNAVLPIFAIAAVGALVRQLNWLTSEADASLLRLTVNLLIPCLIFDSILGNRAFDTRSNIFLPPLIGFGTVALGIPLAMAVQRFTGLSEDRSRRTFVFSTAVYNYGYVPFPLALSLFDKETAAVLFVHNVGVEIALWGFGMVMLSGATFRESWRKVLNPPLLMILATLGLNFTIGKEYIPVFAQTTAHMLGQCAIPFGVLLLGAILADHAHEFRAARGGRVAVLSSLVRLGVLPVLFLLIAKYIPASLELKRVIVLQAAMPAAVFPVVMAKHYGGDAPTALRVVLATSLIGLITIPLWIRAGMHYVLGG
ncbi:MAG TPA: AEC family transporter [Candidatus Acidoferrum sp.]|nr:AEC family transporter [Candidatus Acidoferrum sp.]